jgi:CheY-like chemotaxis protein
LSGIVSYPELLLMDIPADSTLKNPLLTIQKSGMKAATIVQDLLTLARRGVAFTDVVNLNHIVSDYLKSPENEKLMRLHSNIQIETHLENSLLNILGSTVHLSKSIMNLVYNAAEASPEGGKIIITTSNCYIDKPLRKYESVSEGDYVKLTVSDSGTGISENDIGRIFEPFYSNKIMGRSGTGLGLAIIWGTVKDHNGYIDVQSTKGKGTQFTLYFPVTRQSLSGQDSFLSTQQVMGNGESILVIDDIDDQRDIATEMLKKLNYNVTSVPSGEDALAYLKTHTADLLVLDMIMDPGMDGLETYKKIVEIHPNQKAVIVSGFSESERVKQVQQLGAGPYVKKPYLLETIGRIVKEELNKKVTP